MEKAALVLNGEQKLQRPTFKENWRAGRIWVGRGWRSRDD